MVVWPLALSKQADLPSLGECQFLFLYGLSGLDAISGDDFLFPGLILGVVGDLLSRAACNIFPALFSGLSGLPFSKLLKN